MQHLRQSATKEGVLQTRIHADNRFQLPVKWFGKVASSFIRKIVMIHFSQTHSQTHTQTGSIPLRLKIVLICLPFLLPTARSGDNGGCKRAKPPCTLSDAGPQVHLQVLETPNTPIPAGTLFHIHNTQHFQLPFLGDALDGLLPLGILATNNNISWSTPLPAQTLFISIFMHFNLNILPPLSGHHTGRTGGPGEAGKKIESRQLKGHHLPKTPTP